MATDTRPGFRLPWAAGTGESKGAGESDQQTTNQAEDQPAMIETADIAETSEPPVEPESAASQPARRATKFMAELSRAMQAAAEHARNETMARFEVEAKGVVEEIHANATNEGVELRRKADDDVAGIRERSKTEIARVREETEARIAARKTGLEREMEAQIATVEARTERVATVVAAFESQMVDFFERLNAEEDPTRIATMAETMPDPPNLADVAASFSSAPVSATEPGAEPLARGANDETPTAIDFAAAEAEAAAFSGDLESDDDLPAAEAEQLEGAPDRDPAPSVEDGPARELGSTRVVVSGLASVANIANFKRSLGRLPGISTIAVASGPDADFVFTVGHTLGSALSASVQALTGFDIQLTGESDDAINVAAQDRDGAD